MNFPLVTSVYAALLALVFVVISVWVSAGRKKYQTNLGDGDHIELRARMRAHANFAEYVPLILILVALLEGRRTSIFIIHALLLALLVGRILHPFGMVAPDGTLQQGVGRGMGAGLTLLVLVASAILLLVETVTNL